MRASGDRDIGSSAEVKGEKSTQITLIESLDPELTRLMYSVCSYFYFAR